MGAKMKKVNTTTYSLKIGCQNYKKMSGKRLPKKM